MHDPLTQAFRFTSLGLTVWHVDPGKRGDDDSCDWWGRNRPLNPREAALAEAIENMETTLDSRPHYDEQNPSREHREYQAVKTAMRELRRRSMWRIPVRWHVWHWRIRIDAVLHLKRWLFSRCCKCGGRFAYGYSPCSDSWNGTGPRWFRGEPYTYHLDCRSPGDNGAQQVTP